MRAIRLASASGYGGLDLAEDYEPGLPCEGQVLVEMKAAGVTPLEHTLATGQPLPVPPALPLVLGNEGAGIVTESSDPKWPAGTRVAFTGPYGLLRPGTWADATLVDTGHLAAVPDAVPLTTAAAMPVAYLTAYLALEQVGFDHTKSVLAPGAGGSVGNATYQLARAMGSPCVITTAGTSEKAVVARRAGMENVVDLSTESLRERVREITAGRGVDIVIDAVGGDVVAASLGTLAFGGKAVVLGYSAGRTAPVLLTDLIWTGGRVEGFNLFFQPPDRLTRALTDVLALAERKQITPAIESTHPLGDAATALAHLVGDRPFGKVVLHIDSAPDGGSSSGR